MLQPLLDATPPIPAHAIAAFAALALAIWQLAAAKGTRRHRWVGWAFVALMAFVAISALWISEIRIWGAFSPIHLLIPVTLVSLVLAIRHTRRGNVRGHAITMISLVFLALVLTGAFTLLPGRAMHQVVFGAGGATP